MKISPDNASDALSSSELSSLDHIESLPSGSPELRFLQQCIRWNQEWLDKNKVVVEHGHVPPSQIVLFIFAESPRLEQEKLIALGSDTATLHARSLAQDTRGTVLCTENFQQMIRISKDAGSLDDVFQLISDHLTKSHTFAVASLAQKRILTHTAGESIADWLQSPTEHNLGVILPQLTADLIAEHVDNFYVTHLKHPQGTAARLVWKGKKWPYKLQPAPEQRIQGSLLLLLTGKYEHMSVLVDEETKAGGGRADIRITRPNIVGSTHSHTTTMLELKVLANGQGLAYHTDWVRSGIDQAAKYRLPETDAVFACIFDARKDQTDQFLSLDAHAQAEQVRLHRYLMIAPIPSEKTVAKKQTLTVTAKKTAKAAKLKRVAKGIRAAK